MVETSKEIVVEQIQYLVETVYSRDELLAAAPSFDVKPEVVAGALYLANKDKMTRTEAEKAIKIFLERRVK